MAERTLAAVVLRALARAATVVLLAFEVSPLRSFQREWGLSPAFLVRSPIEIPAASISPFRVVFGAIPTRSSGKIRKKQSWLLTWIEKVAISESP